MALEGLRLIQRRVGKLPTIFSWQLSPQAGQVSLIQWGLVVVISTSLGVYSSVISFLPSRTAFLPLLFVLGVSIVMIVRDLQKLLLAIILLDISLHMGIHLQWRDSAGELGAIGGFDISPTTASLVLLYALWLIELLVNRRTTGSRVSIRSIVTRSWPFALYILISIVSILVAHDVQLSLFAIFLLTQLLLLYIYIIKFVRSREDVLFIVVMLLIGLILESAIMLITRMAGRNIEFISTTSRIDFEPGNPLPRLGGTVGSPNTAGGYLSMMMAPTICVLMLPVKKRYKWLAGLALSLGALALLLTFSRGGWIACIVSLVGLCFLMWQRQWLSSRTIIVTLVVTGMLMFVARDAIFGRILGDDQGSAQSRIPLMELAFKMIKDYPIFGIGTNNFAIMIMEYKTPELDGVWLYTVHNRYMLVWAETGTIGLAIFIATFLITIVRGWRGWQFKDRFLSPIMLSFTVSIVGHMIHMQGDVFNSRPTLQLLWLTSGFIVAINRIKDNNR